MAAEVSAPAAAPPAAAMLRMIAGAWVSQSLRVVAELGIADLLAEGPRPAEELAQLTGADPGALYRVLRALAAQEVFREEAGGFALTPLAECLRRNVPGSLAPFAIMMGRAPVWRSWGEMEHSVRTGRPAFEHVFGAPLFDWYVDHPDDARAATAGLTSRSFAENRAVPAAYDFSGVTRVVDVGGGEGTLLRSLLEAHPALTGVLFEKPHVVEFARSAAAGTPESDRLELVAGDFFADVPPAGDVHILKKVLHDWDDEQATTILRHCREAMGVGDRLLVIEHVVLPGNEPSFAKLLDLLMLVFPGGRERTVEEHGGLMAAAGLTLTRAFPTDADVMILEAVPA